MEPKLPEEALKYAIDYCLEHGFSCVEMGNTDAYVFIIGKRSFSPDQIAVMVAHMLLEGIMSGSLMQSNLQAMYPPDYDKTKSN